MVLTKYELIDNLFIIDTKKDYSSHLAYTNEVYEFLFECKEQLLEQSMKDFDWNKVYSDSFSIDVVGKKLDKKKLAGFIWQKLEDPKVDLKNSGTKIVLFNTNEKIICGKLKATIKKDFSSRKAHLRPFNHPTSLHPQLARACINLTGKIKGKFLDPFCGSGGILIESGLLGFDVTGFDIDEHMIKRAKTNIEHFKNKKI